MTSTHSTAGSNSIATLLFLALAVVGTGCQTTGGAADASLPAGEQVLALTSRHSHPLVGTGVADRIAGRGGDDLLRVYGNANTIHYSVGDGSDLVQTTASANAGNLLRLSGVTADEVTLGLGPNRELLLRIGADAADAMRFSTFNPDDVDATRPFDRIEFEVEVETNAAFKSRRWWDGAKEPNDHSWRIVA